MRSSKFKKIIIQAGGKGTISGIKTAISEFLPEEQFMIIWCDLIFAKDFEIPSQKGNYIGISKDFECRWSYLYDKFVKTPSK